MATPEPAAAQQAPEAPTGRPVNRRRQRSTRLTVAVVLLAVAALLVAVALATGSWALTAVAAVLAVVLGTAATKITHSELLQTRRDAARDRAHQAQAYRRITDERTAEHAAFAETMHGRVEQHRTTIRHLEDALSAAQRRAADTTRKLGAEARRAEIAEREGRDLRRHLEEAEQRAAEAIVRVAELEHELDVVRAELDVVTAAWQEAEGGVRRRA